MFFEIVLAALALVCGPARRASAGPSVEIDAGYAIGGLVSGAQRNVPAYPLDENHVAGGLGLAARCYWRHVGGEVELGLAGSQGLGSEVLRFGGVVALGPQTDGTDPTRLDLGAGANHTWLRLDDGLGPATPAAGRPAPGEVASGFGYYVHLDLRWEFHIWLLPNATFLSSVGVQYEYLGPRFPGAPRPFDGHTVEGRFRAGWRF